MAGSVPRSAGSVRYAAGSGWQPAAGVQRSAGSGWRPAGSVQRSACRVQRSACRVQHPAGRVQHPAGRGRADAALVARRGLADLARAFAHDADASAHLQGMLDGKKRAEIMAELGWTVERAKVVQKRVSRGITAWRGEEDEGEDEAPGSER